MDKLERLLNLTAALLATDRPLVAEDLRDRVGGYPESKTAFRRTFERDKDDLRAMGVPLRLEAVPGTDPPVEGYIIHRAEYEGRDLRLEPDELAALHLATNIVRLDGGETGLHKLGGGEGPDEADEIGRVPFDAQIGALIAAAADRGAVAFRYGGEDRTVEPWRLSFSRGHWYLAGWDRLREDERLYRVDRIEGEVRPAGEATAPVGEPDDPAELRGWELGDAEPVAAVVRIDPDQAAWARHVLGDVVELDGGAVEARLQVRNVAAFRSFVLSFLDHAEVLEPEELRNDIVTWLEALT